MCGKTKEMDRLVPWGTLGQCASFRTSVGGQGEAGGEGVECGKGWSVVVWC